MSPREPAKRTHERNDAAIARWLKREYPAIARQANQEKPPFTKVTRWGCVVTT